MYRKGDFAAKFRRELDRIEDLNKEQKMAFVQGLVKLCGELEIRKILSRTEKEFPIYQNYVEGSPNIPEYEVILRKTGLTIRQNGAHLQTIPLSSGLETIYPVIPYGRRIKDKDLVESQFAPSPEKYFDELRSKIRSLRRSK